MGIKGKPNVDLTGQRINYFDVIEWAYNEKTKCNQWLCACTECKKKIFKSTYELTSGRAKSDGCMSFLLKSQAKLKDLTGQRFGRLLVLRKLPGEYRTPQGIPQVKYECLCDCGNIVEVYGGNLKKGNTLSCGCLNREKISERELIDLTGMRFGLLTVIRRVEDYISPSGNRTPQWLCKCDCGTEVVVAGNSLRSGATKSCGHIKYSMGEYLIKTYLDNHQIKYIPEYKFEDLVTSKGYMMRFDFGILNEDESLKFLIEFQGLQHYKDFAYSDRSFGELQRKETDAKKKEYCQINNLVLYEIKYNEDVNERLDQIFKHQNEYVNPVLSF